jgi:putative transcriptional regulator
MSKKAFDKIAEGLNEVLAIAREEAQPARLFVPPEIDVREIRRELRMSQESFASTFGFTVTQIRDWEQGRSRPLDALRAYLSIIQTDPGRIRKILKAVAAQRKAA